MKTASLLEIKQEIQNLTAKEIAEICLRLVKYKKENKELVTYLLFEKHDTDSYTEGIKQNITDAFKDVNTSNLYLANKALRKILRRTNRYIRYASNKQTEAEVLIHFCLQIKTSGIPLHKNKMLNNMYQQQLKKIKTALAALHEDIQYDFLKKLEQL